MAAQRSGRTGKFMLFGNALVRFVGVLDAILESLTFWWQKPSYLIDTGRGITTAIVYQLADLKLVAAHVALLW
jgi:hypothetical protein